MICSLLGRSPESRIYKSERIKSLWATQLNLQKLKSVVIKSWPSAVTYRDRIQKSGELFFIKLDENMVT